MMKTIHLTTTEEIVLAEMLKRGGKSKPLASLRAKLNRMGSGIPVGQPLTLKQFTDALDGTLALVPIFKSLVTDEWVGVGDELIFKDDVEAFYRIIDKRGGPIDMNLADSARLYLDPEEVEFVEFREVKLRDWNAL